MNYTKAYIQDLIETNQKATCRAVVAIYKRQTASEQYAESTQEDNGRGFTAADAKMMTSFAKRILRFGGLTPNQMWHARKRMPKYWRQLIEVSKENDIKRARRQDQIDAGIRAYQRSFPQLARSA